MNRAFDHALKETISNLPEHHPDPVVWNRIEGQLDFRKELNEVSQTLPVYEPDKQIWNHIEAKLPCNDKKARTLVLRYASIAASIAAILVLSLVFTSKNKEKITESVEIVENEPQLSADESDNSTSEVFKFLEAQCKTANYLCRMPEFNEKKQQLMEVSNELKKVNRVMESLGSSPSLFQTKTKLENLKAQLIKDLVKQVTS